MLFVLAVMFLLMLTAGSALTAAFTNYGEATTRRNDSQLDLHLNSMELTVKDALGLTTPTSLNGDALRQRIVRNIYNEVVGDSVVTAGSFAATGTSVINMPAINMPDGCVFFINISTEFDLHFTRTEPQTRDPRDAVYDDEGIEIEPAITALYRIRQLADINNGWATVTITAQFRGLTAVSVTTYQFDLASLTGVLDDMEDRNAALGTAQMTQTVGNWRFISHEKFRL
jgi:hypothetical protein